MEQSYIDFNLFKNDLYSYLMICVLDYVFN